jgi:hypothetical protein
LAILTLTASSCDERPFTREDALAVPYSAIQVGEYRDKDWEYVDNDGVTQKLNRCQDVSPWTIAYRCTSPDGSVELTFNQSKRGMRNATLHMDDKDVPLHCINGGFWTDGKRFCMPNSATPEPTSN